uniref:Uncharacterized protein n=1 Tax=Oryza nivara TaxID=4536 RepID=A0A0E0IT33_ORYNI
MKPGRVVGGVVLAVGAAGDLGAAAAGGDGEAEGGEAEEEGDEEHHGEESHSAHATWKQAPTKPARETRRTTKPITSSGVCSIDEHVAVDPFAIHSPAPITGIDASSVARFRYPIITLLNL